MIRLVGSNVLRQRVFAIVMMLVVALGLGILSTATTLALDDVKTDKVPVHMFADKSEIKDTWSTLSRYPTGVSMTLNTTGLTAGDVVTVWWVIFNAPENCNSGSCGEDDVFMADDTGKLIIGATGPSLNQAQIKAAVISIVGATGEVIGDNGEGHFSASLGSGAVPGTLFGTGLINANAAEVHLLLRDHGPMKPDLIDKQISAAWGGCDANWPHTPCQDVEFAVHMPPA
jgi:hypothetical protein